MALRQTVGATARGRNTAGSSARRRKLRLTAAKSGALTDELRQARRANNIVAASGIDESAPQLDGLPLAQSARTSLCHTRNSASGSSTELEPGTPVYNMLFARRRLGWSLGKVATVRPQNAARNPAVNCSLQHRQRAGATHSAADNPAALRGTAVDVQ